MIPIMIVSNRAKAGKVFFTIGLAHKLLQQGFKVGYIKPLGTIPVRHGSDVFDEDALFIKDALGLDDSLNIMSPFILSYEVMSPESGGIISDAAKQVIDALHALKGRDFVFIHGAADIFEGTALNIDALTLSKKMDARVIMIEPWRGDISIDTILGAQKLFGEQFCGGIFNKVPESLLPHVREQVKPFIEKMGIPVYGIIPRDKLLDAVTVKYLMDALNGRVLCCEDKLGEFVENFSIGAMDVDSALSYFRRTPNKAVITGAHRTDIQLVALETSTKCVVLTGGLQTSDVVISKAQSQGIPIISVETDTFTTVDKIERIMGQAMIREKGKADRAKEVVSLEVDIGKFLKCIAAA
ncbi:MAG TPA: phosphotransacetylase family protein [Dissulfurispiraceae bacterium]|nr:phosphotransacetylase family protein [Dissulfurispiraceae bacterium]